ncbi:MAG: glycosyltransferase [Dysgonamonadaceae bacterium]|nr:glycosyltransferase [Dysgonamonadaceae bacterium]
MKIAFLSPFYPYRGGIAQFSASLYKALEKDHEVKAFSFARLYPAMLFPGKTQYVTADDAATVVPAERLLDSVNPCSYRKTADAIAAYHPDVLVVAYWMSFLAPAYACIARRLNGKMKIAVLLHNAIPHEPRFFDKTLARMFFRSCTHFLVMSTIVQKDLLALQPDARYRLHPHPLYNHFGEKISPTEAREKLGLAAGRKTLLFFGLIRDYKGLDLLIEAMALLDESYQLLIAGESYGPFDKYGKLIAQSAARDRVKVINRYIGDREVPVLFSAADCLVLPYKSATQSGVIPVAYHFEVPVVATGVGGLKETLETAGTGVACLPDSGSLASGIEQLFAQGKDRYLAGIRNEKQSLSWEHFAQTLTAWED